ncbi:MAG: signal transduction histidine kinase [Psychromonas sp.]|jgi:signal transduction histidine kinase|uniref:sensor histidine kinase n=1 Tax=Psychromonas sp. TaxID=1884585 RepID=UPI0039E2EFD1
MIRKILPKSLVSQICLIMLIGLSLVLSLSLQIYSDEREQVLNYVSSDSTLDRLSSLIFILNKTPFDLHEDIISASQGLGFYLSLDRKPIVTENNGSLLAKKLHDLIAPTQIKDIRIVSVKSERLDTGMADMGKMHSMVSSTLMHEKMKNSYNLQLTGSILLANQHWLNFNSAIDEKIVQLPLKAVILVFVFTLLILISMTWTVKRALRPIAELAVAANKVGSERDFKALPVIGPSEVIPTIVAFNQMQSNLSKFINDRTKMLSAISHDLRTPLTSLRLRLEFIEQCEDQARMLDTVEQMEAMLKATLEFSKSNWQREKKQETEIVSLLTTICDDYRDRGVNIKLKSNNKLVFRLWPSTFRRVIENLVNNSIAHGKDVQGNLSISIEAFLSSGILTVYVRDTGRGIDESQFEEVIKPFVRLDKARVIQDSSVGLGLAITHSIIQEHGGKLTFSNQQTGGLEVKISLSEK